MAGGWARMERESVDLSRLTLQIVASAAHPNGVCTTEHMVCLGCHMLAPIAPKYGGPMADCRLCGYAWAVAHDPVQCWRRVNIWGDRQLAAAVRQATPALLAGRAALDEIVGAL